MHLGFMLISEKVVSDSLQPHELGSPWWFPGVSDAKSLPAMWETWVWSLGPEDPLEKEMANPVQYSCLENPIDGGAWWATWGRQAVHEVAKSQAQLSDFILPLSEKVVDFHLG